MSEVENIMLQMEQRIKELELDLGLANCVIRQKTELLESCEKALAERDSKAL